MTLWPISRDDVALIQKAHWIVRPYVFVLALIGLATAAWTGSTATAMLGGVFLGAALAPLMPIWRESETELDETFLKVARTQGTVALAIWALGVAYCASALVLAVVGLL